MDGETDSELLNVRETAARLDVHENTIRNWARTGVLPTARIPGSRFHRFHAHDVERLRRERGSTVSSVAAGRSTVGPEFVDATQLTQWAVTRSAQDRFPELVRRLLVSSPGVSAISVRAGDGVALEGWDGVAESAGNAYLPAGLLRLELGVGGRPKAKADADFENRRDDASDTNKRATTFVFITPRRWRGKSTWADERRAEGVFADVRVLDADDLEGWLQATPAVHTWISEQLGRRPNDAETLERWWERFQARTDPSLPAELFLAGRENEQARLAGFFGEPPSVVVVQTPWRDESIAFVCSAIEAFHRDATTTVQPAVLIASAEVWDRVIHEPGRMTLLPLFDDPDIAGATSRGHHVVIPVGSDRAVRDEATIALPRPDRAGAGEALGEVGISSDRTYDLAALARRSMPSLVRRLARDPSFARPSWSTSPDAGVLARLVLAGGWAASELDHQVVAELVGDEWTTIEAILVRWRAADDPPFVHPGDQWHVASAEEAFVLLRSVLTPSDLQRWHEIAVRVLSEHDPTLTLDGDQRPMAGVLGVRRDHSSVLRRGFSEGVALVGSIGDEQLTDGVSGADHARRVVRAVLDAAAADESAALWQSLSDVMAFLAEAAPEAFLDAVHDDLDRTTPLLASLFQDGDRSSALFTSSPHTGLLWALETLCWSDQHLLDASRALARLHLIDPGGRLSNRPLGSLHGVLVGWIRHTAAPFDLKVQAVEQVCRATPDVGWPLLMKLWPQHDAVTSPPRTPRYRDWRPEGRNLPMSEWLSFIARVVDLALDLAVGDVDRYATLGEHVYSLPPADQERVLDAIATFAGQADLTEDGRLALWERLRNEVGRHQQFSDADWAMPSAPLARLAEITAGLEPTARPERFGYLFDWHPDLPGVDPFDHRLHEERLLEMRTAAIQDVLAAGGIEHLRLLALRSPISGQLGWTLGAVAGDDLTPVLLTWLDSSDPHLEDVATSWARRKLVDHGVPWLSEALGRTEANVPARRRVLVLNAPPNHELWDFLAGDDSEIGDAYWDGMGGWHVPRDDIARAATELLARGRAWVAVKVLAAGLHGAGDDLGSITPELAVSVLDGAINADPSEWRVQSLGYEVGLVLDFLEREGADAHLLARYEFLFFRLLDRHRTPRALFAEMGRDSALFVDLVRRVYRGTDEEPSADPYERDQAMASHAWWVLNHWNDIPGRQADGTIDGAHLEQWVREARLAFTDSNRADIGDEQVGQVLAASPQGADGVWPAEPVRDIIENIGSRHLITGIHVGVVNSSGVTSRGIYDGGTIERERARGYRAGAVATAGRWPRTSRMLRDLADDYERDARRADARADVTADIE